MPPEIVIVAGNPKVNPRGTGFEVRGLDDSTRHALARALHLEREGVRARVLLILDHPRRDLQVSDLLDPALGSRKRHIRSQSPHCDDLHPDIRGPISKLLEEADFPKDRLGILLEGVVFERRKKIFPNQRGCEVAAATALRLASGYIFDPVERKMHDTYIASPVEVFLSPDGGMDEGHLVVAREYFRRMGFKPELITKGVWPL
jgi:hypothetical protein